MSLLVLDPDIADSQSVGSVLCKQLTELGFLTIDTQDPRTAVKLSAQGNVEIVVCCTFDFLSQLESLHPSVGVALVDSGVLSTAQLLAAMRAGVHDVWALTDNAADLQGLVDRLLARRTHWLDELEVEVAALRAELERDQRAGQYIQMGMLPPNPMGIGHFRLQHRVEPSLILSGDFVDYFQISDTYFACYVADVSGHGASSAFVTVLLKNFSRRLRREYRQSMLTQPGEILEWINTELMDQGIDKHVAMFFAIVDTQTSTLHYANAAHLPPAALVVDGELHSLEQKAKPLGLFADIQYKSLTAPFPAGAKLVVFTDGVLDLIPAATLVAKEAFLGKTLCAATDMDAIWSQLTLDKMGPDDVSCLLVEHQA